MELELTKKEATFLMQMLKDVLPNITLPAKDGIKLVAMCDQLLAKFKANVEVAE